MPEKTRTEHLKWCKERALAYLDIGDIQGAYQSIASDLRAHKDTEKHLGVGLGLLLLLNNQLDSLAEMRKFIQGLN